MAALRTNPVLAELRKIRELIERAMEAAEEQARTSAAMWRARDRPKRSR